MLLVQLSHQLPTARKLPLQVGDMSDGVFADELFAFCPRNRSVNNRRIAHVIPKTAGGYGGFLEGARRLRSVPCPRRKRLGPTSASPPAFSSRSDNGY